MGGYWFFKFLSADEVFKVAIVLLVLAALVAGLVLKIESKFKTFSLGILGLLFMATICLPKWQTAAFVPGRHLFNSVDAAAKDLSELNKWTKVKGFLFAKYDPNSHTAVVFSDKDRVLYVNGKPDAATSGDQTTRAMAALTPIALSARQVENVFIAGLGAGLSTAVATKFSEVKFVDVAEISEGVKDALPYFKDFNLSLDQRTDKYAIEVGDAYKVLMSKNKKYDLIICEPSNPWVTGVEKLFSIEFYQQVKNHLHEDGLFAQWFPLFSMDEATFLNILNTYSSQFKWVSVWGAGGSGAITIIGSQTELKPDFAKLKLRFDEQSDVYKQFKVDSPEALLYYQILTPAQVKLMTLKVEDTNSVFAPILEFKAGRGHFANLNVDISKLLIGKAYLPYPKELASEVWPFWYVQNVGFNAEGFASNKLSFGKIQFHILRQLLLFSEDKKLKDNKDVNLKDLNEHLFLLGRETTPPELSKADPFDSQVTKLTSKIRQLNAIGFTPKIGGFIKFIDKNCKADTCAKARYGFLSWMASPEKWNKIFSRFDRNNLTDDQKKQIDDEYLNVQKIYQSMNAF